MPVAPAILHLFRCRWNAPVVVALHDAGGAAFGALAARLVVAPSSLHRSLEDLQERGWVRQREVRQPPYVLTPSGVRIAPPCRDLLDAAEAGALLPVVLKRWTMPIAAALRGWTLRFSELRAVLPGVTPRALALALKEMVAAGLVEREIEGGFPPTPVYHLSPRGEAFLPALQRLG